MNITLLFCEHPLERSKVDPDFEGEMLRAVGNGFRILVFNFDMFLEGDVARSMRSIQQAEEECEIVYRGWMISPGHYQLLYNKLLEKNYRLINDPTEYRNCHYLPESLRFIESKTPATIYYPVTENYVDQLIREANRFGTDAVMIKDYVKSEKHNWDTACFVPDASDKNKLRHTIQNFLELRGEYLNEGIVIRKFVELNDLAVHTKSGMPLTEEYRLFFLRNKLIGVFDYWEEGNYNFTKPDTIEFEQIAANVESNFFSMDIARTKTGDWIIIELGDGQVSGLPESVNKNEFYTLLGRSLCHKTKAP